MSAPARSVRARPARVARAAFHTIAHLFDIPAAHQPPQGDRVTCEQLEDRTLLSSYHGYWDPNNPNCYLPYPSTPYCSCSCNQQQQVTQSNPSANPTNEPADSTQPVEYFSGDPVVQNTDLRSDGFGKSWGMSRSYSADMQSSGPLGKHWIANQMPELAESGGTNTIALIASGEDQRWFDWNGSAWVERFGGKDTLTAATDTDSTPILVLTDSTGAETKFYDFTSATSPGQFRSFIDPNGNVTQVTSYDSNGNIQEVQRSNASGNALESWLYTWSNDLITNVTLRRKINGGSFSTVRQVAYAYYSTGDAGGNAGDLKSATVEDASGNPIDTYYYRYWLGTESVNEDGTYVTQPADLLKFVFSPQAYARAAAGLPSGTTPDNATDAQLSPYADSYFTYNSSRQVYQEVAAGAGGTSTNGLGTFTFAYTLNTNSGYTDGYGNWKYKTVESLPDGTTTNTIYSDYAGAPILEVTSSGSQNWGEFWKYDASGRVLWDAQPSALNLPSNLSTLDTVTNVSGQYDLLDYQGTSSGYYYMNHHSGLIDVTDYAASTTATASSAQSTSPSQAGDVLGMATDNQVQEGDLGTPVMVEAFQYFIHTYTPPNGIVATSYPLATDTLYGQTGGGDARDTQYAYTFQADSQTPAHYTNQVGALTVTPPVISTGQNGSGSSAPQTYDYDAYGRVKQYTDGDGYSTTTAYDDATGAVTQTVVDTGSGHLNLTTNYVVDGLGRTIKETDPVGNITYTVYNDTNHEVRTYSGWLDSEATGPGTTTSIIDTNLTGSSSTSYVGDRVYVSAGTDAGHGDAVTGYNPSTHTLMLSATLPSATDATTIFALASTSPIEVSREYRPVANAPSGEQTLYEESLTTSATPAFNSDGTPAGTEAINEGNIQSLARDLTNNAGQITETDQYYTLNCELYYTAQPQLGSASNDSGNINPGAFHASQFGYDSDGRMNHEVDPAGTITDTTYDALGRVVTVEAGTVDTGGSPNMVDVEDRQYDNGGVGDSTLTRVTDRVDSNSADDRVILSLYDWRDRVIATKEGALITSGSPNPTGETDGQHRLIVYYQLDNLGEVIGLWTYAGDQVALGDFANWTDSGTDPSKLRAWTRSAYDDQGRVYQTAQVSIDPANGVSGLTDAQIQALAGLTTALFYDYRGNLIAQSDPGGLVTKHQYDGAGRGVKDSTTDGGALAGASLDWAHAGSTSSDVVIEQALTTYDADSNVIESIDRQRFDNDPTTATGDLAGPGGGNLASRDYYTAMYYDTSDRLTDSVNGGTNGGSAWTRPGTVPAASDTVLVNHTDYDSAGRVLDAIDPRGIKAKYLYDMVGRQTKTIGAWDGTQNATPTNSTNQTTTFTYDGNGDVLTMTAVMPSGTNSQTTKYVYGEGSTIGTDLFSNDLVAKVEYPDKSTGQPSTLASNDQSFGYDWQGDKAGFTDENGTTHSYALDVLGRLTADIVTTLGAGVAGGVRRLGYSFNDAGLPFQQTSYSDTGGTTSVNQVEDVYNGYGQLLTEYQEHSGAVNTSTSQKVQYAYSQPSGANYSRLSSMTYPNGRVITYGYNSGLDSTVSRVSYLADGATHLEDYTYLGLGTIVQKAHPQTGIDLTYIQQTGETNVLTDGGDRYTGLDRFGRVIDQYWVNPSTPTSPTDRFQYGYDQSSNALYRQNLVNTSFGELYHANGSSNGYDDLNRITNFSRGQLNGTEDTISSPSATDNWNLDAQGNWSSSGSQTRTFNSQNQITAISGQTTPTYDNNGNMTEDEKGNHYAYDGWNRMVQAYGSGFLEDFSYDADGRRPGISICNGTVTNTYYSNQWQDIEDDADTPGGCGGTTTQSTYVWSLSYIDDLVARDYSLNGGAATRLYAQQDANHDVTALANTSGTLLERFIYDPYGTATVLTSGWSTTTDGYNWVYRFQGGRYDSLTGLYNFRSRDYSPTLGRWMQRDPAGYIQGANLYQMEGSSPIGEVDPSGMDGEGALSPGMERFNQQQQDALLRWEQWQASQPPPGTMMPMGEQAFGGFGAHATGGHPAYTRAEATTQPSGPKTAQGYQNAIDNYRGNLTALANLLQQMLGECGKNDPGVKQRQAELAQELGNALSGLASVHNQQAAWRTAGGGMITALSGGMAAAKNYWSYTDEAAAARTGFRVLKIGGRTFVVAGIALNGYGAVSAFRNGNVSEGAGDTGLAITGGVSLLFPPAGLAVFVVGTAKAIAWGDYQHQMNQADACACQAAKDGFDFIMNIARRNEAGYLAALNFFGK